MRRQPKVRVRIEWHGSLVLFVPKNKAARDWLTCHVDAEAWQWSGGSLAVDVRYAPAIADAIAEVL